MKKGYFRFSTKIKTGWQPLTSLKSGDQQNNCVEVSCVIEVSGYNQLHWVGPSKLWRRIPPKPTESKSRSSSRIEKKESVLKEFKQSVGLEGSAVVNNDGETILADLPGNVYPEKMGTMVSRLLQIGAKSASMAKIDPVKALVIEGERGRVVAWNEEKLLVITFSNLETPLGMVKLELEEFAKKINKIIS